MVVFLMFILYILRGYSGACTQSPLSMSHNLLESVAKAKPANMMSIDKVKSNLEMILPYSFLNISHCVAFDISQEIVLSYEKDQQLPEGLLELARQSKKEKGRIRGLAMRDMPCTPGSS